MQDHHAHHAQASPGQDTSVSRILTGAAIGIGVAGVAIMVAPHLLPALGVTSPALAEEASLMIHNDPMGMAGALNAGLALVPFIGAKLAEGGLFAAGVSAATGIGGTLLGQFIEKREDGGKQLKWGTVIQYGALITSALIAMPAILSSLSTGLIYLGMAASGAGWIGTEASNAFTASISQTLGGIGGTYAHDMFGLSGLSAIIPHLVCCGAPAAPLLTSFLTRQSADPHEYGDDSVTADMYIDQPTRAGVPCKAKIALRHRDGTPLSTSELAVVHTEKLHLFLTDSSLKDYQHIHPQPNGEPGMMAFSFTPATDSPYSAWADFTLLKDGSNHKVKIPIASAVKRHIPPVIRSNTSAEQEGLRFEWQGTPLQSGASSMVNVRITDANGNPVRNLQPVMGAYAHLVGFSGDGKTLIHTHPMGAEPASPQERGGPDLQFHIEPNCSGATQFYLQVRKDDKDIYVPFGQHIKPPARATERVTQHTGHAHGYSAA